MTGTVTQVLSHGVLATMIPSGLPKGLYNLVRKSDQKVLGTLRAAKATSQWTLFRWTSRPTPFFPAQPGDLLQPLVPPAAPAVKPPGASTKAEAPAAAKRKK
jgi:hypothetical protein